MKVQAHYPQGEVSELFEADTIEEVKAKIESELSDPENFKYSVLDDEGNQTGQSVKYSDL